ncbi:F-box/WD repeat-containing protein 2-like [Acanthaster planci]|uniref:F-box/WD repeat-containing protein 2-like n=1 Tax=Acanthaster planci TaxID=133434 RepID=A0A8B7Y6L6_ACAPL|nr:F-box/WD repeat-containing protein 2-like [Acanthaster planci]XP_022088853.1 F-box/WD repeat-containing protein 2-like [Acanthaster planci]XP_022088854.1 F-box/WD repeat-containing protein 2-like [Acanthaster planci]XP_022088855.1 F-box/WD repeat-containing protein 2-like [Acanthaster planci]XP_022088856.1 F-box/WD repeat-containing protein 2-like [Acanthaster planci]XP_022088857.1 F-box/WD repeat-containing protein 2-like [Acanthaster planci]
MDLDKFNVWQDQLVKTFKDELDDEQRCATLDRLISSCGAKQLGHLSTKLEGLVKRDFLHLLPVELGNYLLAWLDAETLCRCCLVNRHWNKMVNSCAAAWQNACCRLGLNPAEQERYFDQNGVDWKAAYRDFALRLRQLKEGCAFDSLTLQGHSARVYALHYRDGKLASGSDDLTVRLWEVTTGQCLKVLQTHTCADIKFDDNKLITASFDNTIACWDWEAGTRLQRFSGHCGAVFSVDYSDQLDLLVSGSADATVKLWCLSDGALLNTLHGHNDWVTQVILREACIESDTFSSGEPVLLTMDKNEIKVWSLKHSAESQCVKTLTSPSNTTLHSQTFLPRLQLDGTHIACASDIGIIVWRFQNFELKKLIPYTDSSNLILLGLGTSFTLLLDHQYLRLLNTQTHEAVSSWRLPAYRRSKRGSNFVAGAVRWLDGLGLEAEVGLVFATSMSDHSLHVVRWRQRAACKQDR